MSYSLNLFWLSPNIEKVVLIMKRMKTTFLVFPSFLFWYLENRNQRNTILRNVQYTLHSPPAIDICFKQIIRDNIAPIQNKLFGIHIRGRRRSAQAYIYQNNISPMTSQKYVLKVISVHVSYFNFEGTFLINFIIVYVLYNCNTMLICLHIT